MNEPYIKHPRYVNHSIDKQAIKALVAVYGPREAARQAKMPVGTVLTWCRRYKWKKAQRMPFTTGVNGMINEPVRDAADVLIDAMARHREESALNMAKFAARASKQAANLSDPLSKARAVRDVAMVYATIWPPLDGGEMVEGAILIGGAMVKDNPVEMLADVRQELPDQRPEGD